MELETEDGYMCRMCMSEDDVILYSIFDENRAEESTVFKIWNCLNLKVFFGDGLPTFICHRCLYKLKSLHSFRKMCHTSNDHLSKQFQSLIQSSTQSENMEVELEPTSIVSPASYGIGCIVEGSERTVESEPESNEKEADDETYEGDIDDNFSRTSSRASVFISSDESDGEVELRNTHSGSSSILSHQSQSKECRPNVSKKSPNLVSEQSPYISPATSPQIQRLLHNAMVLFPGNLPISPSSESSSISAILPVDRKLLYTYSNTLSIEPTAKNGSISLFGESNMQGKTTSILDCPSNKHHLEGKSVKVPTKLTNQIAQESENIGNINNSIPTKTAHTGVTAGKNFKENTWSVENDIHGKIKLQNFHLSLKRQKSVHKTNFTHAQVVESSTPDNPEVTNTVFDSVSSENASNQVTVTCPACDKIFYKKRHLKQHIRKYHNLEINMKLPCKECSITFENFKQLVAHRKIHHGEKQPFKCKFCSRKFSHIWQQTRHETLHSDVDKFKCDKCEKKFTSAKYLDKHLNLHTKRHVCEICKRTFSFHTYLDRHMLKCHTPDSPSNSLSKTNVPKQGFSLDMCDSSDNDVRVVDLCEDSLPTDSPKTHSTEEPDNARSCKSKTLRIAGATYKLIGPNLNINFPTDCDSTKTDTFSDNLNGNKVKLHRTMEGSSKQQMLAINQNINEDRKLVTNRSKSQDKSQAKAENKMAHACTLCRQMFANIDDLMSHEQVSHAINKIYSCIFCMKMFTFQAYLTDHRKLCVKSKMT